MSRHVRPNLKGVRAPVSALVVLGALTLLLPADALAQRCQAPPGTSAIEQYCETLPGPAGDRDPGGTRGSGGSDLPPRVVSELEKAGVDGTRLLAVTGRQGETGNSRPSSQTERSTSRKARDTSTSQESGDPISALKAQADSGPSTGPLFLWVLVGMAALLAAAAWARSRAARG